MMNFISIAWGIITLITGLICMLPFLGWGNWIVIPMAIIGAIIGSFSEKKGGLYLCIIAIILACFRLFFGGGII